MIPTYIKEVADITRAMELSEPLDNTLERIELFPVDAPFGSFREFLITSRVHLLLKLRITFDLLKEKSFIKGFEKISFDPHTSSDEEVIRPEDRFVIPLVFLRQVIDYGAFCDDLLSDSSISTIDAAPFFTNPAFLWTKDGKMEYPSSQEYSTNEFFDTAFFVSTDGKFILENGLVWCTSDMAIKINLIIEELKPQLNEFLDMFGGADSVGVAHEYYVIWFQKLFPGKIKYKTLPRNL